MAAAEDKRGAGRRRGLQPCSTGSDRVEWRPAEFSAVSTEGGESDTGKRKRIALPVEC